MSETNGNLPRQLTSFVGRDADAPTMKRVSVPGVDIETWDDDGVLMADRAYFDQLEFLTQLGLVPEA